MNWMEGTRKIIKKFQITSFSIKDTISKTLKLLLKRVIRWECKSTYALDIPAKYLTQWHSTSSSPEIQALFRVYFLRELFFNTQNPLDEILQEKKQFLTKLTACSKRKVISYSIYRNFQSFSPMPIHDARLRAKSRMFWGTLMKLCPGSINVL